MSPVQTQRAWIWLPAEESGASPKVRGSKSPGFLQERGVIAGERPLLIVFAAAVGLARCSSAPGRLSFTVRMTARPVCPGRCCSRHVRNQ
ncbi:hypothetical protein MTO96_002910 [Rhipicephalus appendiculatus]